MKIILLQIFLLVIFTISSFSQISNFNTNTNIAKSEDNATKVAAIVSSSKDNHLIHDSTYYYYNPFADSIGNWKSYSKLILNYNNDGVFPNPFINQITIKNNGSNLIIERFI